VPCISRIARTTGAFKRYAERYTSWFRLIVGPLYRADRSIGPLNLTLLATADCVNETLEAPQLTSLCPMETQVNLRSGWLLCRVAHDLQPEKGIGSSGGLWDAACCVLLSDLRSDPERLGLWLPTRPCSLLQGVLGATLTEPHMLGCSVENMLETFSIEDDDVANAQLF
jgi:hypothetical protein